MRCVPLNATLALCTCRLFEQIRVAEKKKYQVRWQVALALNYPQLKNRDRQLREQAPTNLTLRMVDTKSKITGDREINSTPVQQSNPSRSGWGYVCQFLHLRCLLRTPEVLSSPLNRPTSTKEPQLQPIQSNGLRRINQTVEAQHCPTSSRLTAHSVLSV